MSEINIQKKGIMILAAGEASRMGRPKQLLRIGEESLVARAIKLAKDVAYDKVLVVLGAHATQVRQELTAYQGFELAENLQWKEGIGSSIAAGMQVLLENTERYSSVTIALCDQPLVTAELLRQLIQHQETTGKEIVACRYQQTVGVPAVFGPSMFPHLASLQGDTGAKKVMMRFADQLATINFAPAVIDLDTEENYQSFKKKYDC